MVQNVQSTKTAASMTELAKSQQALVRESSKTQAKERASSREKAKSLQTLAAKAAKSNDAILSELKRNSQSASMTAYQIADKYGISLLKAQEFLDQINADRNGIIKERFLPENSTVSYRV